ncbi:DUF2178 domain-containing protein [Methanococcoides seepicolus]|uniref:DUF2178 domain-containing protein n=1 Tax=Methanococcoides seepicolus TaxID=2828780 RepID=A0A9E4ZI12_9EURY|nr:DUF2178 domain-containing protein [Methanococcoides seepicolus]MCM1987229.1 DUF2178 domain-containing protein [Methanococcoides seepicolus]
MTVDIFEYMPLIIGMEIGSLIALIYIIRRKKSGEPEHDERTEKVTGKAARSTIIVLMLVFLTILGGELLSLIKLEAIEMLAIIFPILLISMVGFVSYYNSKEL